MTKNEPHELKYKVSILVFIIQIQYQFPVSHFFVDKLKFRDWERTLFGELKNCNLRYMGSEI